MGDWTQTIITIVAVLGLALAMFKYLASQFNRIDDRLQVLEKGQASFAERFTKIDERFDSVDERFTKIDERFKSIDARFNSIDARFNGIDARLDGIDARFDRVEERVEQGAKEVKADLQNVQEGLQNVEIEQARMLGFLEGRGVMGKAPASVEAAS